MIPIAQGRAFADLLDGVVFKAFQGSGHYLHNEQPEAVAAEVRVFLDDPAVRATRLKVPKPVLSLARARPSASTHGRSDNLSSQKSSRKMG